MRKNGNNIFLCTGKQARLIMEPNISELLLFFLTEIHTNFLVFKCGFFTGNFAIWLVVEISSSPPPPESLISLPSRNNPTHTYSSAQASRYRHRRLAHSLTQSTPTALTRSHDRRFVPRIAQTRRRANAAKKKSNKRLASTSTMTQTLVKMNGSVARGCPRRGGLAATAGSRMPASALHRRRGCVTVR